MIRKYLQNPFVRFIVVASLLYFSWYACYELYLKPSTNLDAWVIDKISRSASSFLNLVGVETTDYSHLPLVNRVGVAGSEGVIIGAPCDGLILFALFIIFIVSFPGPIKHKWWYLLLGVLLIHFSNVLRVSALAVIFDYNPNWLAFNHDYTFTVLVYSIVFFLWYLWIFKFSPLKKTKVRNEA